MRRKKRVESIPVREDILDGFHREVSWGTRFILLSLACCARNNAGIIGLPSARTAAAAIRRVAHGGTPSQIRELLNVYCKPHTPIEYRIAIEDHDGRRVLCFVGWDRRGGFGDRRQTDDTWSREHYPSVYARDGKRCRYCGREGMRLSIDHVEPRVHGGHDGPENLVVACRSCNSRKSGRTPGQAGMVLLPVPGQVH